MTPGKAGGLFLGAPQRRQ